MTWASGGFMEQGLGTASPGTWLDLLLGPGGWTCQWEGPATPHPLWPAAAPRPVHEWLLARDGTDAGAIRLFHFPEETPVLRRGAMAWDTGGLFDIDLRVRSVDEWTATLLEPQWHGISAPVNWRLGDLQVREWLARGPDGVILALIERLSPALVPPAPAGLSHAFNATQTVRDLDRSLAFYQSLGFELLSRQAGPLPEGGGMVLGLSPAAAKSTPVDLAILSTGDQLNGSIELVSLPTIRGRDLACSSGPGNRGLNLLRIPVRGLESLTLDLQRQGIEVTAMARWECAPHGMVRGMALRSPDGAWLELLETE
jgi:catechol 2,3-dioxygenase-like lactoylglutathione lyase family enzyme